MLIQRKKKKKYIPVEQLWMRFTLERVNLNTDLKSPEKVYGEGKGERRNQLRMNERAGRQEREQEEMLMRRSKLGAIFLILTQVLSKLLTFILNQLLIKLISPRVVGTTSYLEFLYNTSIFFGVEGERLAIQRVKANNFSATKETDDRYNDIYQADTERGLAQRVINFGYIPLLLGIPLSTVLLLLLYKTSLKNVHFISLPFNKISVAVLWVLIILELGAEPIYAFNMYQLRLKERSRFEAISVVLRCVTTYTMVLWSKKSFYTQEEFEGSAVLAFTLGQFFYSFSLFFQYHLHFWLQKRQELQGQNSLLLKPILHSNKTYYYFDPEIFSVWKNLCVQLFFKQFLTEGDKILINQLFSVEEQGVYSVITNHGSMIARLVFQPIEETLRLILSRIFANKSENYVFVSLNMVKSLCIFYCNFSLLVVLAGYTNASYGLLILLGLKGSKWLLTNLFDVFPKYFLYIPFLAFNGILETFLNSAVDSKGIQRYSKYMVLLTIIYLLTLYLSVSRLNLGLYGIIVANVVNMSLRIAYCSNFMFAFYKSLGVVISICKILRSFLVSMLLFAVTLLSQYVVFRGTIITRSFMQLFVSFLLSLACLLMMAFQERETIKSFLIPGNLSVK